MSLACKIFASFLLIFNLSAQETDIIQVEGILNKSITLDIPNQQLSDADDIAWCKNNSRIARVKGGVVRTHSQGYQVSVDGSLTIKHLQRSDNTSFEVVVYNKVGQHLFTRVFNLRILERVSKPEISWNCTTTVLTCKVTNGTDPELKLYQGQTYIKGGQKIIKYKWTTKPNTSFKCTANNSVDEETSEVDITCPEKGLDIYLIIGICGGGVLFLLFVALLILFASRRRRVRRRRNDGELETTAHRMTSEERSQKPHQIPASAPQNPATCQPPPPPGHRPKAHGHRAPPPGQRAQHPPPEPAAEEASASLRHAGSPAERPPPPQASSATETAPWGLRKCVAVSWQRRPFL